MKHGSLFNGIGGFQLAAHWMGWENVFSCEIDEFCNKVTKKHFPNCIQHGDIKKTDFTIYRGAIDILTGGFPCQPFSNAGKRKGTADLRYLWPENFRAIKEIRPAVIVGENVYGIVNWSRGLVFEQVCADLESEGYEVQPVILPACGKEANHIRQRVWFVAHLNDKQRERQAGGFLPILANGNTGGNTTDINSNGQQWINSENEKYPSESGQHALNDLNPTIRHIANTQQFGRRELELQPGEAIGEMRRGIVEAWSSHWSEWPVKPTICGDNDGLSGGMDRVKRIKALGNAIVPQIAYEIFKAIENTVKCLTP